MHVQPGASRNRLRAGFREHKRNRTHKQHSANRCDQSSQNQICNDHVHCERLSLHISLDAEIVPEFCPCNAVEINAG